MNVTGFRIDPDIHGNRLRARWRVELVAGEKLTDVPRLQLARKELDYEFPAPAQLPDPCIVYDSGAFPTGGTLQTIATREGPVADGGRQTEAVESVSAGGVEVLRRTLRIRRDPDGNPVRVEVEVLDASGPLAPLTTYYYELRPPNWGQMVDRRNWRSSATTTARYRLGQTMYNLLPEIYRRHDVVRLPVRPALAAVPEAEDVGGQLRRFLEITGSALDFLRSRADGLLDLHNIAAMDARFLPLMSAWIGWSLDFRASIPEQRHEIRYAAALYRITGTIPGCMIWIRRLTGWDARIKEFGKNVFFSNDLGNPQDPTEKGSFTVNTADPAQIAKIKTFDDALDYTYDSGRTNQSWYSYNTIGIFLKPGPQATVADVRTQTHRLHASFSLFLPVNVRAVIALDLPETDAPLTVAYGLLNIGEQ